MDEALGLLIGLAVGAFIIYKMIQTVAVFVTEVWGPRPQADDDDHEEPMS